MSTVRQTIGYWLKHTDEVITARSDQALNDQALNDQALNDVGFTRTRWQVLNLIEEAGAISRADHFAVMRTFITASQLDEILDAFAQQGWLIVHGSGEAPALDLTEAGKVMHERVFARQREVRQRAMQGISGEEYAAVISVLQRMIQNLE